MARNGNVTLMIFPIIVLVLIIILIGIVFICIQLSVQIYDIKNNIFYLVQSSVDEQNFEKIAYRDYSLNTVSIKRNLNYLLEKNYLNREKANTGIVSINCNDIKLIVNEDLVKKHTNNMKSTPIICVSTQIGFVPIMNLIGKEVNINIHDDIKLALLEFN